MVTGDVNAPGTAGADGELLKIAAALRGVTSEDKDIGAGVAPDGAADGLAALGGGPAGDAAGVDRDQVGRVVAPAAAQA